MGQRFLPLGDGPRARRRSPDRWQMDTRLWTPRIRAEWEITGFPSRNACAIYNDFQPHRGKDLICNPGWLQGFCRQQKWPDGCHNLFWFYSEVLEFSHQSAGG